MCEIKSKAKITFTFISRVKVLHKLINQVRQWRQKQSMKEHRKNNRETKGKLIAMCNNNKSVKITLFGSVEHIRSFDALRQCDKRVRTHPRFAAVMLLEIRHSHSPH